MLTDREQLILDKLRLICLQMPEVTETTTWDHPNFRVAGKIFCVMGGMPGEPNITLKVGKPMLEVFLAPVLEQCLTHGIPIAAISEARGRKTKKKSGAVKRSDSR